MAALLAFRSFAAIGLGCHLTSHALADALIPPPAYQLTAHQAGVPPAVLYAIALQESGIQIRGKPVPWPWTLNVAGQSRRFATREAACMGLRSALATESSRRVDVGLGQVNAGYHGHRVLRPCDLLNPYRNLAIAAAILREQYRPEEDWLQAMGRYHRPAGGAHADRYRRNASQHLLRIQGGSTVLALSEE